MQPLADGIVNALTNINGGSTHCNIQQWLFWRGNLTNDELRLLYDKIIEQTIEVYSKTEYPFTGDKLHVSRP